jgi:hypothetical protein
MEDEFIEEDTEVVDTEEIISQDPIIEEEEEQELQQEQQQEAAAIVAEAEDNATKRQTITFDDIDRVRVLGSDSEQHAEEFVNAPKTLERLEEISIRNFAKRKEEEDGYDDDDETDDTLRIGDPVSLGDLDVDEFSFDS